MMCMLSRKSQSLLFSLTHPFSLVSLQRSVHELHRHLLVLSQPGQDKLKEPPGAKKRHIHGTTLLTFSFTNCNVDA